MKLPLTTARLVLRRFTEADVPAFHAYRNDPALARYQSWESCDLAAAKAFIRLHQTCDAGVPGQWLQIAIALNDTNELIGDCALKVLAHEPKQATMGGTLARRYHWRGYAMEAFACLIEAAFLQLDLHRVVADTDPENTASWKLMERLGLRREAHLQQSLWFKGRWADEYIYAVLREEWFSITRRRPLP